MTLSFFRFDGMAGRLWALGMMGAARLALARLPGLSFWKLCGSGSDQGFTPIPNTAVYAILAVWDSADAARAQISGNSIFETYQKRASEHWTVFLTAVSARGRWSGAQPFDPQDGETAAGPIAALTRASIKPAIALRFWRQVPDISKVIGADPNVLFKIGIGEVPLLHQVTFSIWPDTASMAAFARRDGPHARAIKAVRDGNWFSEELYARFRIQDDIGSWGGISPLHSQLETQ